MMKKEKTLRMAVTGALLLTVVAAGTGDAGGRQQRCDE